MKSQNDIQVNSKVIADLLDAIPQWDDGPITITELFSRAGLTDSVYPEGAEMIIPLLRAFDVISIFEIADAQELRIKSRSELSSYFLRSLALYLREDRKILSNWERSGVTEGPFSL